MEGASTRIFDPHDCGVVLPSAYLKTQVGMHSASIVLHKVSYKSGFFDDIITQKPCFTYSASAHLFRSISSAFGVLIQRRQL